MDNERARSSFHKSMGEQMQRWAQTKREPRPGFPERMDTGKAYGVYRVKSSMEPPLGDPEGAGGESFYGESPTDPFDWLVEGSESSAASITALKPKQWWSFKKY